MLVSVFVYLFVCLLVLLVSLAQDRVTWEEGTLIEEMLLSD